MSRDNQDQTKPKVTPQFALDQYVRSILACALHGCIGTLPAIPPDRVLVSFADSLGMLLSQGTATGDMIACMKLRREMREAFEKGIQRIPITAPVAPPESAVAHLLNGAKQ